MPHSITQLLLLIAIYLYLGIRGEFRWLPTLGIGVALGLAFGIRPLTAVAAFLPFGVDALILSRRGSWRFFLAILLGASPFFMLLLLDQREITGSYLTSPYSALHGHTLSWEHLSIGASSVDSMFGFLPSILWHTPRPLLGLFFALSVIPLLKQPKVHEILLVASFLILSAAHLFVNAHGLHGYGPRFLYEGTFALFILTASGVVNLCVLLQGRMRTIFVLLPCTALLGYNCYGLYNILPTYHAYNGISRDLFMQIKALPLEKSIVVATSSSWQGLEIGATLFDPEFKQSLFIQELPDTSHLKILASHSERKAYIIRGNTVEPYEWQKELSAQPPALSSR